ncbi:MAG: hypothetical protein DDT20_01621 [Firmicutes bacterium]|nr:hypothetical protein [Bacillota bacterium]
MQKDLRSKPLLSVYLLCGIEEWYIEQATKAITSAASKDIDASLLPFNVVDLDARGISLARLVQELHTPPFMTARKVVRVENCPYFAPRQSKGARQTDAEALDEAGDDLAQLHRIFAAFPPDITLICGATAVNMRMKITAAAKKCGAVYDFSSAKRADAVRDAQSMLHKELKRLGVTIAPQASAELLMLVGVDDKTPHMRQLWQEVMKLAAFKGYTGAITLDDVVALTPRSAEAKAFLFTDAFSQHRKAEALWHLRQLWQDGEEPLMVLSVFARHIRQMAIAREMLDEGVDGEDVAKALGGHPFVAGKLVAAARTFAPEKLREMLANCFEIDNKGKSGRGDISFALEMLVTRS